MATIAFYNDARRKVADKSWAYGVLKVMLVNNYTVAAAHSVIADITTTARVGGNGWETAGATVVAGSVTLVNTNEAMLDANDIAITATGGNIGPANGAVLYDSTGGGILLWYIDFGSTQTAGTGTAFAINWHANGIARWTA